MPSQCDCVIRAIMISLAGENIGFSGFGGKIVKICLLKIDGIELGFGANDRSGCLIHREKGVGVLTLGLLESFALDGGESAETAHTTDGGGDLHSLDLACTPLEIDLKSATGTQSLDLAVGPYRRKRGQQIDESIVALHEHLGYTGHTTEVSIDLERRMRIEEVGICATFLLLIAHEGELVSDQLVSMIAIEHTCPQAHFPSHAPTGGRVATVDERGAGGIEELGSAER